MKDSIKKSVLKTFSWRAIATLTTMVVAYVFVGDVAIALSIGGVEFIVKMIIYFIHERAWSKIE